MNDLAEKASVILKVKISKGKWETPIYGTYGIDRRGAFGKLQTDRLLVALCQYVEDLEDRIKLVETEAEKKIDQAEVNETKAEQLNKEELRIRELERDIERKKTEFEAEKKQIKAEREFLKTQSVELNAKESRLEQREKDLTVK